MKGRLFSRSYVTLSFALVHVLCRDVRSYRVIAPSQFIDSEMS